MKYCPNCGNKIENTQVYSKKYSKKLVNSDNKSEKNKYQNSKLQHKISRNGQIERCNSKLWAIIVSIIVVILLVVALMFAGYYFYKNVFLGNSSINIFQSDSETTHDNQQATINVLSSEFSENFMNADNTGGYEGFNIGMSKHEIKSKFGEPDNTISMDIGNVEKYHNIGIYYGIDGTVSS